MFMCEVIPGLKTKLELILTVIKSDSTIFSPFCCTLISLIMNKNISALKTYYMQQKIQSNNVIIISESAACYFCSHSECNTNILQPPQFHLIQLHPQKK